MTKLCSAVLILILLSSSFAGISSASERHENFDKAKTDLQALYASLNRTKSQIVDSLNHTLLVNYSLEYNSHEGSFGYYNYTYEQEELDVSEEISRDVSSSVLDANDILKEIEGKVSSYEYVKEYYQPFYKMSVNLTAFSEEHDGFIRNITDVIGYFNNASIEGDSPEESILGMENFNDASYNLERMKRFLNGIKENYEPLRTTVFDIHPIEWKVNDCEGLIEHYEDLLSEILSKYESLPLLISLYSPDILHPGEEYKIEGFLIKGGEYVSGTSVEIYIDGDKKKEVITGQGGHYLTELKVPWNRSLGDMVIRCRSPSRDIESDNRTVNIVKWGSYISVESDKEKYYDEIIELKGSFTTDAPISYSNIILNSSHFGYIQVQEDGNFELELGSEILEWGEQGLSFEYAGNGTISRAYDSIIIERSIPTKLVLESNTPGEYDLEEPLLLNGVLTNKTSGRGIGNKEVFVKLDGKVIRSVMTEEDGSYSIDLNIDELKLENGNHRIKASFKGTKVYRGSGSDSINLFIDDGDYIIGEDGDDDKNGDGDDDDKIFGVIDRDDFIVLIFVVFMTIFSLIIYFYYKEKETSTYESEETGEEDIFEEKEEPVLSRAERRGDISNIYGHLIERLENRGIISIKKGKTHRDLLREISDSIGLEDEVRRITDVFEKAYFTQRSISNNELSSFNQSLNKIEEEVLW